MNFLKFGSIQDNNLGLRQVQRKIMKEAINFPLRVNNLLPSEIFLEVFIGGNDFSNFIML